MNCRHHSWQQQQFPEICRAKTSLETYGTDTGMCPRGAKSLRPFFFLIKKPQIFWWTLLFHDTFSKKINTSAVLTSIRIFGILFKALRISTIKLGMRCYLYSRKEISSSNAWFILGPFLAKIFGTLLSVGNSHRIVKKKLTKTEKKSTLYKARFMVTVFLPAVASVLPVYVEMTRSVISKVLTLLRK